MGVQPDQLAKHLTDSGQLPALVTDVGVRLPAHLTATGRGSGITIDREDAMVCRLRDGLTTRIDYFNNQREAFEAAGLSE